MSTQLVPITGTNGNRDFALFEQHEPKLRQLFLEENKSLAQVKQEMEAHHGFPKIDTKIYEYAFRHLELVKKLGVEQWVQVDAHVRKRKREGKETEVLLSGVPQPLAKIARAISRHKRGRLLQDRITKEPIPDCPEPVLLKTPPSSPYITTIVPQHDLPPTLVDPRDVLVIDQQAGYIIDFEQRSAYIRHQMMSDPGSTLQRLVDVPSSQPILVLANDVQAGRFLVQEPPTPDPRNLVWDSAFKRSARRYFLDALSKATIIMANNPINSTAIDSRQLLGWIGADTNTSSLRDFFSSNLPALAASWPKFISLSQHSFCGDAFRALVEVGLTLYNGKWIKQHSRKVIYSMMLIESAGMRKITRQLLSYEPIQKELREINLQDYLLILKTDIDILSAFSRVGARFASSCERLNSTINIFDQLNVDWSSDPRHLVNELKMAGFNFDCRVSINTSITNVFRDFNHRYDARFTHNSGMDSCFSDIMWLRGNFAMYPAIISQNEYTRTNITIVGSIIAALEGMEQLQLYLHSRPSICITDRRLLLETAFSLAAGNGLVAAVQSLGEVGVDPNTRVLLSKVKGWEADWHPLMRAARAKDLTTVRLLLEMGSGLGLATELLNPLAAAVWTPKQLTQKERVDSLEIMSCLLQRGIPPQKRAEAMIKAVAPSLTRHTTFVADEQVIDTLLTAGQGLNEIIEDGKSILHLAIDRNCSLRTVEILVSRGAQIHSRPCIQDGKTMVHSAAASYSKDRRKIIEFLLDSGADCATEHGGPTVLESVLSVNEWVKDEPDNLPMFSILLSRGARTNGPEVRLPNTSSCRISLVVRLLRNNAPDALIIQTIEAGADISLPDTEHYDGHTPLVTAIMRGRLDLARQLIYQGADVNAIPPYSAQGALHAACNPHHADVSLGFIQYLLDNGADINAANVWDTTALESAIARGSMGAFCLLLDAGAAISGPTDISRIGQKDALATAAYNGRLDMVDIMLKKLTGQAQDIKRLCKSAISNAERMRHFAVAQLVKDFCYKEGIELGNNWYMY